MGLELFLVWLGVVSVGVGALTLAGLRGVRAGGPAWARVADQLSLRPVPGGGPRHAGVIDGFHVELDARRLTVRVSGGGILPDLKVAQGLLGIRPSTFVEYVTTGDEAFDRDVVVSGDAVTARALLDHQTRSALLEAMGTAKFRGGRLRVSAGAVASEVSERLDEARLHTIVEDALRVARRLTLRDDETVERLAAIVTGDPLESCRRRAFAALMKEHRRTPTGQHVLREVTAPSFSSAMRLDAAELLGEEGAAVVEALLDCDDPVVVIRACVLRPDAPGIEARLVPLLGHARSQVQILAAVALGRVGSVSAVEPLMACAAAVGPLTGAELRRPAEEAVASIQSRIAGAGAGRVTLTSGADAGAVTVVEQAGAVRVVAQREAGAVSVAHGRR